MPKKRLLFSALLFWVLLITMLSLVSFRKIPKIGIENSDKYVHFTFYFVLTLLLFINFIGKYNAIKTFLISIFVAIIYGMVIEVLQEVFTLTRKAEWGDVFFNTLGSLTAGILLLVNRKRLKFLK